MLRLRYPLSCSFCPWDLAQDLVHLDTQYIASFLVTEGSREPTIRAFSLEITSAFFRFAPEETGQ